MKKYLLPLFMIVLLASCEKPVPADGIMHNAVKDYDGNIYDAVRIGEQVWMKQNLKTTHYADGTPIPMAARLEDDSYEVSYTEPFCYYPDGIPANVNLYGMLYNWKAVLGNDQPSESNPSGVQGVCPKGWHLPSDAEWHQLTDYVSSRDEYVGGDDPVNIAQALADDGMYWEACGTEYAPGAGGSANNATGFSILPAGCCYQGIFSYIHFYTNFWSSTDYNNTAAYTGPETGFGTPYVNHTVNDKTNGLSVRCVKD